MNLPKINLHIHSNFSDGRNTIEQIVRKCINLEMDYICITDHLSNSLKSKIIRTLDDNDKIETYLKTIFECNRILSEKKNKLRVLKGVEIDISSDRNHIIKLIDPTKFDLILFEYLETYTGVAFITNLINQWKHTYAQHQNFPLFGLAHFDPAFFFYSNFNPLIDFMTFYNIIYEFNSCYPHSYSTNYEDFFYKLKENQIMFSIGADSHELESLMEIEIPLMMLDRYNLDENFQMLVRNLKIIGSRKQS
jgi:DNA polymerase (family 10)